ncbi:NAD(P)H-binding protein [Streptosporangium sp. NPDC023963]|uniref:NAD(P)H-binding protein n=1 Tax=Streptosporangium sp. NPDC023963 TaxID=3155608 RepID=UPI00341CD3E3
MIVVTGATGTVGRRVIDLLLQIGQKVTAITRNPATAALPNGVQVVYGDPSRPETLRPALDGVEAVLLSPRAVGNATTRLLALVADLRRVVVLSAATVEFPVGHPRFHAHFRAVEDAVRTAGPQWTFLRCADFAANALAWAPQIRATGIVRGAYGAAATSPVHQRDIAEVAVRALLDAEHAGHSYVLTGPQSLTQGDKVRVIGSAIGQELTFQEISPEQVRRGMLAQGLPEEIPDRLLGSLADYAVRAGPTTDTVERLLGRPALTFADWAADHAAAFRA